MNLQDAIEQYTDMVVLGSAAVQRLTEQEPISPQRTEMIELLSKLVELAEQLKSIC